MISCTILAAFCWCAVRMVRRAEFFCLICRAWIADEDVRDHPTKARIWMAHHRATEHPPLF